MVKKEQYLTSLDDNISSIIAVQLVAGHLRRDALVSHAVLDPWIGGGKEKAQ